MGLSGTIAFEAAVWIIALVLIARAHFRQRIVGVGLVLAYVVNLWLIHWPAAVIYIDPGYTNWLPEVVEAGFRESTFAIVGFSLGVLLIAPRLHRLFVRSGDQAIAEVRPDVRLAYAYMAVGLV